MKHPDPSELLAQNVLTVKEREVWVLYHRHMSQRAIAVFLGLDRSTVRDRIERARRKMEMAKGARA